LFSFEKRMNRFINSCINSIGLIFY
jgi:hypothetical protein